MNRVTAGGPCRTAILISGSGTNLQALIDRVGAGTLALDIALVVSNRPDAYGLVRATGAGINTAVLRSGEFRTREAFDQMLSAELHAAGADLILLAGFMRILGSGFVRHFAGRILNIHPALLPCYPGLDTHARVLAAGDTHHGSTVHFVTEVLDGGPRVLAGRIAVRPTDTPASLQSRVQSLEHCIYPEVAEWFAAGRLTCRDGAAWLDGQRLDEPVVRDFDL